MIALIRHIQHWLQVRREVREAMTTGPLATTMYNREWLIAHQAELVKALPATWTHIDNIDFVDFGLTLCLLDVPWEDRTDLDAILTLLEVVEIVSVRNVLLKGNPDNPFNLSSV